MTASSSPELAECVICHEVVHLGQRDAHLAAAHPTPIGGFEFFHNAVGYRTDRPSMRVTDLLAVVGASAIYQVYEDREGTMIPFSHEQSVDLTNGPRRFYSLPPARG